MVVSFSLFVVVLLLVVVVFVVVVTVVVVVIVITALLLSQSLRRCCGCCCCSCCSNVMNFQLPSVPIIKRDKFVLDTFVHERKHRVAKAVVHDIVLSSNSFENQSCRELFFSKLKT